MTDNTPETPERIFCKEGYDAWTAWGHWSLTQSFGGVEYFRADVAEAMVARAIAAERERCAEVVEFRTGGFIRLTLAAAIREGAKQ